jgi:hypothetical protein
MMPDAVEHSRAISDDPPFQAHLPPSSGFTSTLIMEEDSFRSGGSSLQCQKARRPRRRHRFQNFSLKNYYSFWRQKGGGFSTLDHALMESLHYGENKKTMPYICCTTIQ